MLIGLREFPTKRDALNAIRVVLYGYAVGAVVARPDDQELLASLVALHPDPRRKIGVGIDYFEVRQNGTTRGFWIVRMDGTETDFSFMKCLRSPTHAEMVRAAMRRAVKDQVIGFRDREMAAGSGRCPITGDTLSRESCHVDHADPTFLRLADRFVAGVGGYEAVPVTSSDGAIGHRLPPNLLDRWRSFHSEHARLRVVSIRANLSLLRRQA